MDPVIGITERGDAAIDLSWKDKLNTVDACIVITKNAADPAFQAALLEHKNKCILHATITGWGSSALEPHVPHPKTVLASLEDLIQSGFPREQIVIRIDPIMPWNLEPSRQVMEQAIQQGFRRFRMSILDDYRHVTERFHAHGLATAKELRCNIPAVTNEWNGYLLRTAGQYPDLMLESCAEPTLQAEARGCVSDRDMDILGLPHGSMDPAGYQRPACRCYSGKRELLTRRKRCPHGCLYCYWYD